MSLNLQTIIQRAQAFSPVRFYQPEQSIDFPLVKAVVDETNLIVSAASTQTNFIFTGTITADVAPSWATLFTVTGANQMAQVFDMLAWCENQTVGGGGVFSIDFRYSYNDPLDAKGSSGGATVNLSPGTSLSFAQQFMGADVGTTVEWSYQVTGYVGPSSDVRAGFSIVQRN